MHWLALYCPTLPLDCILRRWPARLEPVLAVTDLDGSRRLIAAATRLAQQGGVFAGQSIAMALALLPDLILMPRKPEDEQQALTEAALAVLRFTPTVALRDAGLLLEISASLRLFGGRRRLKKDVLVTLKTQGLVVAAAEAPTPHGAWLLAQDRAIRNDAASKHTKPSHAGESHGRTQPDRTIEAQPKRLTAPMQSTSLPSSSMPSTSTQPTSTQPASLKPASWKPTPPQPTSPQPTPSKPVVPQPAAPTPTMPLTFLQALDALPIAHLDHGRHLLRRLDGIGCTTLADLRRLPVQGLARRFGPALVDEIARASGDKPDPQEVFEAPSRFATRLELMARVDSADALIFAAQRLLDQLAGWLAARRAAVRGFALVLHHERWSRDAIAPTTVAIALATPTRELDRLVTLVRERLSRLELKAPVLEIALEAPAIVTEKEAPGRLFAERDQATETLARLLEKLVARLGHDALTRIERVADHRPERAWRTLRGDLLDTRTVSSGVNRGADPVIPCGPRPTWLLTEPLALEIRLHRPCFESLPLDLVAGPERIETGWWDDAPATRDYFIAENAAGHLVWIYRERLPLRAGPQWYLQGLFA